MWRLEAIVVLRTTCSRRKAVIVSFWIEVENMNRNSRCSNWIINSISTIRFEPMSKEMTFASLDRYGRAFCFSQRCADDRKHSFFFFRFSQARLRAEFLLNAEKWLTDGSAMKINVSPDNLRAPKTFFHLMQLRQGLSLSVKQHRRNNLGEMVLFD